MRGDSPVEIETVATHHGPVVAGEPRHGHAIACAYTAIAGSNATFDAFVPMLRAQSAHELEAAMRAWVEPVNNLVFADVDGHIGYRARGHVPLRSMANAWVPVPGWTGEHEWRGMIPFEEMPVLRDPDAGFVATANGPIAGASYPHYIGLDYAPSFRTRRVVARIEALEKATADDMAAIHADRVCIPARELVGLLGRLRVSAAADPHRDDKHWRAALTRLAAWDGVMDKDQVAPAIYTALRERLDARPDGADPGSARARGLRHRPGRRRRAHGADQGAARRDDRQGQPEPLAGGRRVARGARERARGRGVGPPRGARRRHGRLALGAPAHDAPRAPAGRGLPEAGGDAQPARRRGRRRRRDGQCRGVRAGRGLSRRAHVRGPLRLRPRRLGVERLGRAPRRLRPSRQPALGRPARGLGRLPASCRCGTTGPA